MKSAHLFLLGILISFNTVAQVPTKPENPPSPQAWNFLQYGKTPISHFTGIPSINLLLDEVGSGDVKIPVALNYNIGAVKPDLHPGWTGLGWNMPIGGVINRKVRGLADEFTFQQNGTGVTYNNGYRNGSNGAISELTPSSILMSSRPYLCQGNVFVCGASNPSPSNLRMISQTLPFIPDNITYLYPNCYEGCTFYWAPFNNELSGQRWARWENSGVIDNQPDEFSFNVMGLSGKFFIERGNITNVSRIISNRKVTIIIPPVNMNKKLPTEIRTPPNYNGPLGTTDNFYFNMSPWTRNQKYPETIWYFIIKDDEGNEYHFGRAVEDLNLGNIIIENPEMAAIEYGIDIYNIAQDYWTADSWYLTRVIPYNGPAINFVYNRFGFQTNMYLSSFETTDYPSGSSSFEKFDRNGRLVLPSILSRVYSENFDIKFSYSESSQLNYTNTVGNIYSHKPGGEPFLSYSYTNFTTLENIKWPKLDKVEITKNGGDAVSYNFYYNNDLSKRLMLQEVKTKAQDQEIIQYKFNYNNLLALPNYLSGQTDHWGYWNGKTPSSNDISIYTAEKAPNSTYLYAGTLEKITYPTGGFTTFQYEPNEYGKVVISNRASTPTTVLNTVGGGLRIKKIEDFTQSLGAAFNSREFFYKNSYNNQLTNTQIENLASSGILNMQPTYFWQITNMPFYNPGDNVPGATNTTTFNVKSSQPLYYQTDDYQIGYSQVIEKASDGSYSIYKFTNHDDGHQDDPYELGLHDLFNSPFTKYNSRHFERGLLKEKLDYNNNNVLMQKKSITYKPDDPAKPGVYDFEANYFNTRPNGLGVDHLYNKWVLFGTRFKHYNYKMVPDVEETFTYESGQPTLTNKIEYTYNHFGLGKPSIIQTKNSKGEELQTILKYGHDYPGEFMLNNIARNKPATVIEALQLKKDKQTNEQLLLGATLSEYALSVGSNMPWLNSAYKLELTKPVAYSSFQQTVPITRSINGPSYSKDSRYKELLKFPEYINYYQPTRVDENDKQKTVYIYGNRNNNLIASVVGDFNVDVFNKPRFTSFEKYYYYNQDGYIRDELDGTNDFLYSASPTESEAFSGKFSFNGIVETKDYVHSGKIYFAAKSTGPVPVVEEFLGTYANAIPLVIISEKGGWTRYYANFSNGGRKVKITTNGNFIDDLYVLPTGASLDKINDMTSYSYLYGKISTVNSLSGTNLKYEYDKFNRLHLIKDHNGHILKRICYNYSGQVEDCGILYYNAAKSGTFTRNNCGTGFIGGSAIYTVPANTFSAESQAAADALAQADVDANGQTYANTNGTCTPLSTTVYVKIDYQNFTNNGSTVTADVVLKFYNDAAGTIPVSVSNLNVNVESKRYNCGSTTAATTLSYTFNCSGTSTVVMTQANMSLQDARRCWEWEYAVKPGTGYTP